MTVSSDEIGGMCFVAVALVIGGVVAAYQNNAHTFRHDWGKWRQVIEEGLGELYLIQERECKTCGLKEQRKDRRPV